MTRTRAATRRLLQGMLAPLLLLSLWFVRTLYRPDFHRTSPWLLRVADQLGIYPVIDHYHDPLVRPRFTSEYGQPRDLPGIDLREAAQLKLLKTFTYQDELRAIPGPRPLHDGPYYHNPAYPPHDAQVLHSMLRWAAPRRVIEVGSGESTRFMVNALAINHAQGRGGTLTCIEPYEAEWLESAGVTVLRTQVENLPVELFASLDEGDVLFIDSSHVVRPGGDVLYLFQAVLPRLRRGVIVHVHDVLTPRHYPWSWTEKRWFWAEQYLVEAMLTRSDWLKVLLSVNHLVTSHASAFAAACPVPPTNPAGVSSISTAIWLEVS